MTAISLTVLVVCILAHCCNFRFCLYTVTAGRFILVAANIKRSHDSTSIRHTSAAAEIFLSSNLIVFMYDHTSIATAQAENIPPVHYIHGKKSEHKAYR